MAVEMEGLEFQIETTTSEAVKGVDALANTFRKFKTLTKGGLGLGSSVKQLEKLDAALKKFDTSKLEGIGKALESVSKLGEVKISGSVAKQLNSIADVMDRIKLADIERLEDMAKALRDLGEVSNVKIPKIRVPASGAMADAVTPATGTAATSGMTQATSSVQEVSAAVDQVTRKTISFKSVLSSVGGVFKKEFSLGIGVLHKLANAMTKVASTAGKAVKNLLGFNKTSAGTATHTKHVTSGLGRLLDSFKRIAMYRLVRFALSALTKAMKEGINNLYQYSNLMGGQFAISMNSVATNALYLKNSLGAMAAPIINALAPAIDYLSGKIVSLLNLINMLIARLTGSSTYTAAKKISASYGDAFDSAAGSAKDAADKIKSYTTGIDELNIIQETPDNGSGGGGGGGADYGSMFEEIPIDSKISDFADRLKEAFDNADWKTLGTLIGTKVNEILDSVDYSGIGKKIGYVAKSNLIVTAEEAFVNIGSSSIARSVSIELQPDTVKFRELQELQDNPGHFNKVMQLYIQWIINHYDQISDASDSLLKEYREVFSEAGHARLATAFSQLMFGYAMYLLFLKDSGQIDGNGVDARLSRAKTVFLDMCDKQSKKVDSEKPTVLFTDLLKEMLETKRVIIRDLRKVQDVSGETVNPAIAGKSCIGYRDDDYIYLIPQVAYTQVYSFYGEGGYTFPASKSSLWKMFMDEGKLSPEISKTGAVRLDRRKKINGGTGRYIWLSANIFDEKEGDETNE